MSQLGFPDLGGIVLAPEALDEQRGAWCSPPEYTEAAGDFDVDPFSNPRSTVRARLHCMLEHGDDGFGLHQRHGLGNFYRNPLHCVCRGLDDRCAQCGHLTANAGWRTWFQPPYDIVLAAQAHYIHTRYTALLRLDTSTEWFERFWLDAQVIMVPKRDRLEFVPPPGVKASSNPFPHGLYYKRAEDVTPEISALCYPWPCPRYPYVFDPLNLAR